MFRWRAIISDTYGYVRRTYADVVRCVVSIE